MSSNFDKYTDYKPNAGVSTVVFGKNKPVLESEMNELQEITKHSFERIINAFIEDGMSKEGKITYSKGVLTISPCTVSCKGIIIKNTGLSVPLNNGQTAYLKVLFCISQAHQTSHGQSRSSLIFLLCASGLTIFSDAQDGSLLITLHSS